MLMASTYFAPVIARDDYDAIRRIVHGYIPRTHDEWAQLLAQKIADLRRAGKTVHEVEIYPDEVTRFLALGYDKANASLLWTFASAKAMTEPQQSAPAIG